MSSYYAIEFIGYGRSRRYAIRYVSNRVVFPVQIFRTEEAANRAAASMGLEIMKRGDFYAII